MWIETSSMNDEDIIAFVRPYTSVSRERLQNVLSLVDRVVRENIPGDLAEVGVWKGGIIMAMALKCKQLGVVRTIHAYDTFSGMTAPTAADVDLDGIPASSMLERVKCEADLASVLTAVNQVGYPSIVYHVGDITTADPTAFPSFALLRLDTDWYESTRFELMHMEPRVSVNGFIIVDDYGHWRGSRRAVNEFAPPSLNQIDYTGVWWQKDYGLSKLQVYCEGGASSGFARVLRDNFHHFIALGPKFHRGCGSYLVDGQRYAYQPETFAKQEALFRVGKSATSVLEVGVYLGHSLLILLLSNPALRITCIDNDPSFTPAAVAYLNAQFGNRIQFHLGDSQEILRRETFERFDVVHIDADHRIEAVRREFALTKPLAAPSATFVFDDYEAIRSLIDGLVTDGELELVETPWCLWTNTITRLKSVSS
jgi:O-methyltransferase